MTATSGGVTALFRTFGLSLGPAAGALSWSLTGGGVTGFRTGVAAITVATVIGIAALAVLRFHVRRQPPERSASAALESAA
jgi:hypothetical protein